MKEQNYKNHARYVFSYHVITGIALLALIIGSFINLYNSFNDHGNLYSASLIALVAVIMVAIFLFARSFALKAQDRAIRSEENLRHYVLTGRRLDQRLSMSQIIALRFASDEEMPLLAEKAIAENLSSTAIKQSVLNWRADHNRV